MPRAVEEISGSFSFLPFCFSFLSIGRGTLGLLFPDRDPVDARFPAATLTHFASPTLILRAPHPCRLAARASLKEGWSFIAAWTGVPLSHVLNFVGINPNAKFVVLYPYDTLWDSIDMLDALHPQTTLAYALNGQELPTPHGAPLRLRVPRQLGYKSIKYLSRITVTDSLKHVGDGRGSSEPAAGYSWFAGI